MLRIRENARALRAFIALSAVLALGVVFFVFVQERSVRDATFVRRVNMMLWGISELNYASQLLSTSLIRQAGELGSAEDTQIAFEVMWSRFDIIRQSDFEGITDFRGVFAKFETFLVETEPILFSKTPPTKSMLLALEMELTGTARLSRQTWLKNFGTRIPAQIVARRLTQGRNHAQIEVAIFVIVSLLTLYVFAEIVFAGRAQRTEKALRIQAASASEAKSQFIAAVSHEIRTPLNGMIGATALLEDSALNKEQRECVKVLDQTSGVLMATINDVLDFSKLEAGKFTINTQDFDICAVLDAVGSLYAPLASEKSLALSFWHDPDLLPRVMGDPHRVQQVLNNLVSNAIKFTHKGGVEVTAEYRTTATEDLAAGLYIRVADTGIGIAEVDQDRVFQPFGQSSGGLARAHGGTGLGLTICLDLCRAMDGDLTLESAPDEGSVFEVFLPFEQVCEIEQSGLPAPSGAIAAPSTLDGLRVLIVDDTRTNRFILKKYLAPLNCSIVEADSGLAALELVERETVDVVLMDVQMPHMDGITATRKMLENLRASGRQAPCIIGVTANTLPEQIDNYLGAGMTRVLAKPVSKKAIQTALREFVAHDLRGAA